MTTLQNQSQGKKVNVSQLIKGRDWSGVISLVWDGMSSFSVGFFAGLVSVFLPRMMLLLSADPQPSAGSQITLFHWNFVALGLAFALVIGVVSVIFEASEKRHPKEVFMAALGIPAILSGVLNTTSATNKIETSEQGKALVERRLNYQLDLTKDAVNTFELLGDGASSSGGGSPPSHSGFSLIPAALAQSSTDGQQEGAKFDPGIRVERAGYVVVIKEAKDKADALASALELRRIVPSAKAVRTEKGYFVIDSSLARPQSDAALDAVQLRAKKLNPTLLQIPTR